MTGLAIGSSVLGASTQASQARTQRRALAEQRAAQQEEIRTQKALEAGERVKQARAARARLRVAAGESNITGVSFEDMLFDSYLQEDLDLGVIAKDEEFAQRASEARYRSGTAGAQGPSALEIGLNIAGAGFSGYQSGLQIKDVRNRVKDK